jgi:hypothetical protein
MRMGRVWDEETIIKELELVQPLERLKRLKRLELLERFLSTLNLERWVQTRKFG